MQTTSEIAVLTSGSIDEIQHRIPAGVVDEVQYIGFRIPAGVVDEVQYIGFRKKTAPGAAFGGTPTNTKGRTKASDVDVGVAVEASSAEHGFGVAKAPTMPGAAFDRTYSDRRTPVRHDKTLHPQLSDILAAATAPGDSSPSKCQSIASDQVGARVSNSPSSDWNWKKVPVCERRQRLGIHSSADLEQLMATNNKLTDKLLRACQVRACQIKGTEKEKVERLAKICGLALAIN